MMIENEWRMIHGNSSLLAVRSKGQSYRHIFQCEKQSTTEHNTYVDKLCTGPIRLNNKIIIIIWWLAMLKKTQNHRECSRNLFWANESSSSMCSDSCFCSSNNMSHTKHVWKQLASCSYIAWPQWAKNNIDLLAYIR